jgi:short-subunit dehydrogenase
MPTALVTGATAGIGAAFARRLAVEFHDLILVARDADRLDAFAAELRDEHGVEVEVLAADLATDEGCGQVEARLADPERAVDLLVNNAGIGLRVPFLRNDVEDEDRMLRLNVRAVMRLTHAVLPVMTARRRGDIINVSSIAGFGPTAPGSTYSATKAWVTNFSESLHIAVRPKGVRVVALCPGFVRTEFHQRAGIATGSINDRMWLDAESVARAALADLRRGRAVSTPSLQYKVLGGLVRHVPRPLFRRVIGGAARRAGRTTD